MRQRRCKQLLCPPLCTAHTYTHSLAGQPLATPTPLPVVGVARGWPVRLTHTHTICIEYFYCSTSDLRTILYSRLSMRLSEESDQRWPLLSPMMGMFLLKVGLSECGSQKLLLVNIVWFPGPPFKRVWFLTSGGLVTPKLA